MEPFFVLVPLALLAMLIIAFATAMRLRTRVHDLEMRVAANSREIAALERRVSFLRSSADVAPPPPPVVAAVVPADVAPPPARDPGVPKPPSAPPTPMPSAAARPTLPPRPHVRERAAFEPLEEKLGTRLPVWIGSIALALAGAFLVKYSFDRKLLSPAVRIALGIAFGLALIVAGERFRRSGSRIAQGLAAAGIAVLYAAFFAAVNLYHLLTPTIGFGLMALTTATGVALSLRHGVMVALVGLVGGFLTPALVRSEEPRPAALFAYLLLLQVGLLGVTRRRGWSAIAVATVLAGIAWVVVWTLGPLRSEHAPWIGAFLVASSISFVVTVRTDTALRSIWLDGIAVAGSLLAMALVTNEGGRTTTEWLFLGLLVAGAFVLARWDARQQGVAWVAAASVFGLLALWIPARTTADGQRFLLTVSAFGVLLAAGAYVAHLRAPDAGRWAALSAASGVTAFLLAYDGLHELRWTSHLGVVALGLAAAYAAAALPILRRRAAMLQSDWVLAALAFASTAFVSLAVPIELKREWLAVAWAVELPLLAWTARVLLLPMLRWPIWPLAALVAFRLFMDPAVLDRFAGAAPVWNWILYGYGVPLVAFVIASGRVRRDAEVTMAEGLELAALAVAVALVGLEIRHGFHRSELREEGVRFAEWGAYSIAGILLGWIALVASRARDSRPWRLGGAVAITVAAGIAIVGSGVVGNPAWQHDDVGATPVLNGLLLVYGAPALL
ncbi:MAG: DUF2339 domain-containing protein, partial [Planctomycetes bacterium]|nr:DUF2339 domain-containing protein [Planctomycetota bacterium]